MLVFALLVAHTALAHDADILYVQAERAQDGFVHERITLTPASLQLLAPVDADGDGRLSEEELRTGADAIAAGVWDQCPLASAQGPCRRTKADAALRDTYVELNAAFECAPGELTQRFRILSVLPAAYRVVLGTYGKGELQAQAFAAGNEQTLTLLGGPKTEQGGSARGLFGWIALGVQHIFLGVDHLAFLLGVLLVGGSWKRLFLLVTSFTVAHSITLGATALGVVKLSGAAGAWVEVLIALSIVWIALENLILKGHSHRAVLTFAFGLIHGFGFASVLMGYGLGRSVVSGLFGFNLGVEVGQACVVAVLFPLLRLAHRRENVQRWTVRVASSGILLAGVYWLVQRVLAAC